MTTPLDRKHEVFHCLEASVGPAWPTDKAPQAQPMSKTTGLGWKTRIRVVAAPSFGDQTEVWLPSMLNQT